MNENLGKGKNMGKKRRVNKNRGEDSKREKREEIVVEGGLGHQDLGMKANCIEISVTESNP